MRLFEAILDANHRAAAGDPNAGLPERQFGVKCVSGGPVNRCGVEKARKSELFMGFAAVGQASGGVAESVSDFDELFSDVAQLTRCLRPPAAITSRHAPL
ncbi:MAG TPA: hypothetical protein VI454_10235 [Verrucomicrobiae bacterium]|jgi:hypothetical protein